MKIKTSELTSVVLDWSVASALGWVMIDSDKGTRNALYRRPDGTLTIRDLWHHSSDWSQGGPIIERNEIYVRPTGGAAKWGCYVWGKHPIDDLEQLLHPQLGPTPLIAAMRCFVASKLGDEVDVPGGLV